MTRPSENLDQFLNALQVSIQTPIRGISIDTDGTVVHFDKKPERDESLDYFTRLIPGAWDLAHTSYRIRHAEELTSSLLINFLLLTRLQRQNMKKLAEMDNKYGALVGRMGLGRGVEAKTAASIEKAAEFIFAEVEKKKMTLRELAEITGLTQVSISKFKAGRDVRLSNFIKIAKALGLKIKIEP